MKCKLFHMSACLFKKICLVLLLFVSSAAYAQNMTVTGTVTDQDNEPVIGISVVIKGTSTGVISDLDGNFSLSAPSNATLVFTYIGLKTKEVPVAGKSVLKVQMESSDQSIDELVVIGYGTQRKADLTTAVASVNADEWTNRAVISAQQGLQGKAAGVQVIQPSGKPGVGMQIRVRGTTSLNAGNEPLYVVDGIQTNDVTNIAPSDIASMQILKDASSAAIYGTRGANGVVLITTKKGTKGKAKIDFTMYGGFSNITKQLKTLNTKDYYDLQADINTIDFDPSNQNYTNWQKETYGTGYQQNYQVSLSGGSENTTYFLSTGYQNETGIVKPAEYDRFSFRGNISTEVAKWLKVNSNTNFARNNRRDAADNKNAGRGGVVMSALNTPPFMGIWNENLPDQYQGNPFQPSNENPLALANTYDNNREYRFMSNLELDFTIAKDLHFKPSISVDYTSHTWDKFIDPIKTQYGREVNGRGEHANDDYLTWQSENIITYNLKVNDKHNFNFMGGMTLEKERHNNAYMSGQDFVKGTTYKVMTLNMANKINDAKTIKEGSTRVSYLARVQYDYLSRYLLTASLRADGSSKLYNKWDYFPSVSAGWRFSSEEFFLPLTNVVDDAKLRVSYGRNGNANGVNRYNAYDKYDIQRQETVGQGPSVKPGPLGNRNLSWEIATQYNIGLDVSMFNSRLTAEFDAYYKKTTDLLLNITLPASAGIKFPLRNDGEMLNKGFEFNVSGQILTGDVKWDANVNMSFNKNELSKLGLTPQFTTGTIEGVGNDLITMKKSVSMGTFYGYISDGVDPETGNINYRDLNNDGRISDADRTIIGSAQPDFIYGMTHNVSWKNISLSAFFQGSQGGEIYNATRLEMEKMENYNNQSVSVLNRWKRPGMISDIPRAGKRTIEDGLSNYENSTRFLEDGSYFRLKSLTLAYDFDSKLIKQFGISRLNIYGTVNNLFTLTKYRGYDPELSLGGGKDDSAALMGIDLGTYPQTRSFIFGLNLTF